ncbi:MAG: Quinoprotein glucose dehydrogenase [Candidatus Woesebacteria bacterium GW2011_GWB1_38_5]|uniref:Quinoprotein glucose dehydrogenase n=1 Tax=Candidatus Woesebacteria bacterium GW2011_GWB1_38_5 TaxID=1618568 RepID=A0A0G0K4X6_9BACT|nr:MAG: Quinoprotein glucose dehydrogenase [Candidatus Woesebacteria bacterium GW2011_GWB1_38_5]
MKKKNVNLAILIILSCFFSLLFLSKMKYYFFAPRNNVNMNKTLLGITPAVSDANNIEIVAEDLDIPWEIAFLPDGNMLVTERSGKLLKIGTEKKVIKEIEGVRHLGEGGLLGLSLHPDYSENYFIYLYSTTSDTRGISNRVERYRFSDDRLSERKVVLEGIAGSSNHDGGRIAFGPDGYLYIATGDAENPALAQNKNSLNGKILRITDEGTIPADNPYGNAVYSLGHRNPQGIAWDEEGDLWITEHGPSGSQTGYDEVNIIKKGGNYGWPEVYGDQVKEGFISPVIQSGSNDTWAPSGMTYWNGNLIFSGLRGQSLYKAEILNGKKLDMTSYLEQEFGRIRAVILGPDGFIYITTSNRDGRGQVARGDDKIIKINPKEYFNTH